MDSTKNTFYVIGYRGPLNRNPTEYLSADYSGGFGLFDSNINRSPDDVPQYPTITAAIARLARCLDHNFYRIIRVDRTITPGTTVRRLVKPTEITTQETKLALRSKYKAYLGGGRHGLWSLGWSNSLDKASLFANHTEMLNAFGRSYQMFGQLQEVVVERVIVENTAPTVEDILTVLE